MAIGSHSNASDGVGFATTCRLVLNNDAVTILKTAKAPR